MAKWQYLGFMPTMTVKAFDPLKVRFAIAHLKEIIPDRIENKTVLVAIAKRADDISAQLPSDPAWRDCSTYLRSAADYFRTAIRFVEARNLQQANAAINGAEAFLRRALSAASSMAGAHRSVSADLVWQEADPLRDTALTAARRYLPHLRSMQVRARTGTAVDGDYVQDIARAFNGIAKQVTESELQKTLFDAVVHLAKAERFSTAGDSKNVALHLAEAMAHLVNI